MRKFLLPLLFAVILLAPAGNILADDIPPAMSDQTVTLNNPLAGNKTDVPTIIGTVIKGILGVIGAVVLLMFIWGAQKWLTAAGSAEKIKAGAKTMVFAALGAFIVFFSYIFLSGVLAYLSTGKIPGQ